METTGGESANGDIGEASSYQQTTPAIMIETPQHRLIGKLVNKQYSLHYRREQPFYDVDNTMTFEKDGELWQYTPARADALAIARFNKLSKLGTNTPPVGSSRDHASPVLTRQQVKRMGLLPQRTPKDKLRTKEYFKSKLEPFGQMPLREVPLPGEEDDQGNYTARLGKVYVLWKPNEIRAIIVNLPNLERCQKKWYKKLMWIEKTQQATYMICES